MKTEKEKSLSMAVKLIKATKGKQDTAILLKQVVGEIERIRGQEPKSKG